MSGFNDACYERGGVQAQQAAPMHVKQLYVLAAFEVEKARDKNQAELTRAHGLTTLGGGLAAGPTATATASTRAQATLAGLVTRDAAASKVRMSPRCCDDAHARLNVCQGY